MTVLGHERLEDSGRGTARRNLVRAWVATGLVALMIVLMPAVPTILAGVGLGIEGASFLASAGVLAVFVLLLDTLAVAAVVSARRARRAGSAAAGVPLVVSAGMGAMMTLLLVLTVAAHLLGFE